MAGEGKVWLDRLPDYASSIVTIGSLVFSVGMLWSDVNKLKIDVQSLNQSAAKSEVLNTRMNLMQIDVDRGAQTQGKLDVKLDAIISTLGAVQVGVARLEEKVATKGTK